VINENESPVGKRVKVKTLAHYGKTGTLVGRALGFIDAWEVLLDDYGPQNFYTRHIELLERPKVKPLPLPG
jgi:hypothetical protein